MPLAIPKTATAIVCKEQGDIEVLQLSVVDLRLPGPEEVLVKVEYTGYVFPRYFYSSWRIFERGPHLSCNSVNFIVCSGDLSNHKQTNLTRRLSSESRISTIAMGYTRKPYQ